MSQFEDLWRSAKHYHVEDFQSFRLVNGLICAPTYINGKWRIYMASPATTLKGATFALPIATGGGKVVPFMRGMFSSFDRQPG